MHERRRGLPGQPDEDARLDHRLRDQEHVRRTRAREAGDGVEQLLGDAHDDADRAEDPLRLVEVRLGGVAASGDRGGALAHEGGRVGHRPHDRPVGNRFLEGGQGDARRDRQHQGVGLQRRKSLLQCGADVAGLHGQHHDVTLGYRPRRARHDSHAPEPLLDQAAPLGFDLGNGEGVGFPAGVEHPGQQRLAHATAAQQRELQHKWEGNGGAARPEEPSGPPRTSPNEADRPAPRARTPSMYRLTPPGARYEILRQSEIEERGGGRRRSPRWAGTRSPPSRRSRR